MVGKCGRKSTAIWNATRESTARACRLSLVAVFTAFAAGSPTLAQTVISTGDELVLPQYAVRGASNTVRQPYVCQLHLSGLTPNATYRYFTGASNLSNITTSTTPGAYFGITNTSRDAAGFVLGEADNKSMNGALLTNNAFNGTAGSFF